MNHLSRLAYMKRRFSELEDQTDAVLSVTENDLQDEMGLMDSIREHHRDQRNTEELTSDAI